MPQQYNAIIIGAGHNRLTCACYLARAGLKVLVLEQYHTVGGMTVTGEKCGTGNLPRLGLGFYKRDVSHMMVPPRILM